MADKIYVGKGRHIGKYGHLKLSLNTKLLVENANDKGYVSILVSEMRKQDDYGNTHTVIINDYVPLAKNDAPAKPAVEEDLPF